jgi:hypothetical protein
VTAPRPGESARANLDQLLAEELGPSPLLGQPGTFGSLAGLSSGGIPQMIGDLGPLATRVSLPSPFPPPRPPGVPGPRHASMVVPLIRDIKISENQSPRPQDRVYFTFNYFQGVNDQVNQRLQAPIGYTQVFRYIAGFEKTFNDGQGSFGLRVPIDTVTAMSNVPRQYGNFGGTSTAVGDLSLYFKYILLEDRPSGSLLSGGLGVTPPTGPGKFAGFDTFASPTHTTTLQPFLAYIVNRGRVYIQGFSIIDVACNSSNPTLWYNDAAIGYLLRQPDPSSGTDSFISLIAPTFEVHVNTPLNHTDPFNPRDPIGSPNIVDFTYGLNVGIYNRSMLTFAIVTPVSSPKPFDFESMVFLNVYFGRTARRPITPPVVGGF